MIQRFFSSSTIRACQLGNQRVALRVPRLASKLSPTVAAPHTSTSTNAAVQCATVPEERYGSRRSISATFGLLAGSTASARTGFRSRRVSTWSRTATTSLRYLSSTSTAYNLRQEAKDKLVEEGKKFAKDKVNQTFNAEEAKQQAKKLSSSTSKVLFAGLAVAGAAYLLVGSGQTHAEGARKPDDDAKSGADSS